MFDESYSQIFKTYRPLARHIFSDDVRRKEHDNLHQFTREMAFAHKIITDGQLKKKSLFGKNKSLIRSINLSLHYLGLLLMEHYESYSPIPVYLWRECNTLYGYAQTKHIEDFVCFPDNYFECLPTIEQTFARTCLMSLSDPYHLSLGEHWQTFEYLYHWADLVEFSDISDDFSDNRCFVIQLNGQLKPEYGAQSDWDSDSEDEVCFMLTHEMIRQIKYHIDELQETQTIPHGFYSDVRQATALALLENMRDHWNAKIERKGRRYPILTKVDLVWGLKAIHNLLSKHHTTPDSTHWDAKNIENYLKHENKVPLSWDANNVSDKGIGITRHNNIAHRLKVGELVIIREYIDQKPSFRWRPAICRWLYGDENQGTTAGLEFIDGSISPARLINKRAKSTKVAGQLALLLKPPMETAPKNIIAVRGTFSTDRAFLFRHTHQEEDIKTRTRALVTPCVEMFTYQTYEVVEIEEPKGDADDESSDMIPWTSVPSYAEMENSNESEDDDFNLDSVRLPGDH